MRKYLLASIFFIAALPAFCQWNSNTSVNNTVANSTRDEYLSGAVTDGANGSIVFFQDNNIYNDIYAQKISSAGAIAWGSAASPVAICVTTEYKDGFNVIADGSGGAFITWSDYRNNSDSGEIYIQRINSSGVVQWGVNGIRVTNSATHDDLSPVLCSDGAGGVIVAWYWDDATNRNVQSYAQRYNGAGTAQWVANGVQVCTAAGFRGLNNIVSDGNNGAIIFFLDSRDDPHGLDYDYVEGNSNNDITNGNIYAQRLDGSGARKWTNNGAPIITAAGNQQTGIAIPDGSGGAIFVFNDGRNDTADFTNNDVFAQRVNANGAVQWAAGGVVVSTAEGNQFLLSAVSDGAGGVVSSFIYETGQLNSQRITAAGAASWTANGIVVAPPTARVFSAQTVTDGGGNTIITYITNDNGATVRAQKISSSGALQWPVGGVIISNAESGSPEDASITNSDNGGAVITWNDSRNFSSQDVYASKILASGALAGSAVATYVSAANGNWNNAASWVGGAVPPAGAAVTIHHTISCNVNTSCSSLTVETQSGKLTVMAGFKITIGN